METGRMSEGTGGSPGSLSSGSDKGKSGRFFVRNHIAHRGPLNHPIVTAESGFSLRFSRDLRGPRRPRERTRDEGRRRPVFGFEKASGERASPRLEENVK